MQYIVLWSATHSRSPADISASDDISSRWDAIHGPFALSIEFASRTGERGSAIVVQHMRRSKLAGIPLNNPCAVSLHADHVHFPRASGAVGKARYAEPQGP
jgi:hypothetical protein